MLKLKNRACTIGTSVNARVERHGEEPVPAMDIGISMLITAKELNAIMGEPHTVDAWFSTPGGELPEPLLKNLKPYKLRGKFENCSATFTLGVNSLEVKLTECKFSSLAFDPQVGGMTEMKLKIQTLITNKNHELFLWMGRDESIEMQFGELVESEKQTDLDLQVPDGDDAPINRHGADEKPAAKEKPKRSGKRKSPNGIELNS